MRWMWIDRFLEFESGRRAVSLKNVSLVEEQMDEYFSGSPVFPASLIVEGLAQTGGLLVSQSGNFAERVVLAKLSKAIYHAPIIPAEQIIYTATIEEINPQGAIVRGTAHVDNELRAEVELVFAHLDDRFPSQLFDDRNFMRILRLFNLFEVARTSEGKPIDIPAHLLAAEASVGD